MKLISVICILYAKMAKVRVLFWLSISLTLEVCLCRLFDCHLFVHVHFGSHRMIFARMFETEQRRGK